MLENTFRIKDNEAIYGRKLLIKDQGSLELYLIFIFYLIKFRGYGKKLIAELCVLVKNSYWNCYMLSGVFHAIVKIMKKVQLNKDSTTMKHLAELCSSIFKVNLNNNSLKEYIGLLKNSIAEHSMIILDTIIMMENIHLPKEVIMFQGGANSGIKIVSKSLPKEGYCFFGFLRLEHSQNNRRMCIYKFCSKSGSEISLCIKNEKFVYTIFNSQNAQTVTALMDNPVANDKESWNFIEFQHINTSHQNIVFQ